MNYRSMVTGLAMFMLPWRRENPAGSASQEDGMWVYLVDNTSVSVGPDGSVHIADRLAGIITDEAFSRLRDLVDTRVRLEHSGEKRELGALQIGRWLDREGFFQTE